MPKNYVVEESFDCKGLPCCVIMTTMGHRCGYVGVYKNNKFWGCDYDDVEFLNKYPDVHGGLTYSSDKPDSGYPIETSDDIWWFGFDCGHSGDKRDKESVEKYFPEYTKDQYLWDWDDDTCDIGTIRTQQYVHDECVSLAGWLSKYVDDVYLRERTNDKTINALLSTELFVLQNELSGLEKAIEDGDMDMDEICVELGEIIKEIY